MKIKTTILSKFKDLTSKEIDFMLHIARYQNEDGIVRGLTCKNVSEEVSISKSEFYKAIKSLDKKGFIEIDYSALKDDGFWSVKILNNSFPNKNFYDGYINLNVDFLYDSKFRSLKKPGKLLLIMLYVANRIIDKAATASGDKDIRCSYSNIMYWLGYSSNDARLAMKILAEAYPEATGYINAERHKVFSMDRSFFKTRSKKKEGEIYNWHILEYALKINKCRQLVRGSEEFTTAMSLMNQFRNIVPSESIVKIIVNAVIKAPKIMAAHINKMICANKSNEKLVKMPVNRVVKHMADFIPPDLTKTSEPSTPQVKTLNEGSQNKIYSYKLPKQPYIAKPKPAEAKPGPLPDAIAKYVNGIKSKITDLKVIMPESKVVELIRLAVEKFGDASNLYNLIDLMGAQTNTIRHPFGWLLSGITNYEQNFKDSCENLKSTGFIMNPEPKPGPKKYGTYHRVSKLDNFDCEEWDYDALAIAEMKYIYENEMHGLS